jgi:hypothetical protein
MSNNKIKKKNGLAMEQFWLCPRVENGVAGQKPVQINVSLGSRFRILSLFLLPIESDR